MAKIEDVYSKFGPKQIHALVRLLCKHVPSLQEFTEQQIVDALDEEIEAIPDYEWMRSSLTMGGGI